MKRLITIVAATVVILSTVGQAQAQEQRVLWRQIKIGEYGITWPGTQGAASTCLTNDGSGVG